MNYFLDFRRSRFVTHSIIKNVNQIHSGKFTQIHVKELIIDLREYARHCKKNSEDNERKIYEKFVDFSDLIAHPNKKDPVGSIYECIQEAARRMSNNFDNIDLEKYKPEKQYVPPFGHSDELVCGLLFLMKSYLTPVSAHFDNSFFSRIAGFTPSLALYTLAISQDVRIEIKGGYGILHFRTIIPQNYLSISCRLHYDEINEKALAKYGKLAMMEFPVICTNYEVPGGLQWMDEGDNLPRIYDLKLQESGRLAFQPIDFSEMLS